VSVHAFASDDLDQLGIKSRKAGIGFALKLMGFWKPPELTQANSGHTVDGQLDWAFIIIIIMPGVL